MAWFADLAGRAESLLNNLDESTGAVIRNHNTKRSKFEKQDYALHPDGNWAQKRRIPPQNSKKIAPVTATKSNYTPSRKASPTHHQSRSQIKDLPENKNGIKQRKSPGRKGPQYHLNNCPKTMVNDVRGDTDMTDHFGFKQRRFSLPSDLELISNEGWTIRMQNLEVENAMLKNELNVMNREVSELLDRLRKAEDGNNVVSKELSKTHLKLESSELENHRVTLDKDTLASQLDQIKKKITDITIAQKTHEDEKQRLLTQIACSQDTNNDLEERIREITKNKEEIETSRLKLENELRHSQSTIADLQSNLDKSNAECQRLERDWESYKVRVKNMLFSKDSEIKALQDGLNLTVDTKVLMEQLENLKGERDELSEAISRVHNDSETMKAYLSQVEARHEAAERVVIALRDALRDERGARNRAEAQCVAYTKELKSIQLETGQTIASLRTALRDKESEMNHLRETTSSVKTADTSALNVADYDVTQDTIDNEKIHYLTQTLVQRQGKVDKLLAENNMLRIQLDKIESKYKSEMSHRLNSHSVVNLSTDRQRRVQSDSMIQIISNRMAAVLRRHPAFRILIVIYMICLHFWVMTVLLTSSPESYIPRQASNRS